MHRHILELADASDLGKAVRLVRYEDLCAAPRESMAAILQHCGLPADPAFLSAAAGRFHAPAYYRPSFDDVELAMIAEETAQTAQRLGYGPHAASACGQSAQ
jgi:hypothetical protein